TPTLPAPGTPTTSRVTLISGPTTIQNGQILWKFQAVGGPDWETGGGGTNRHRFTVTVIPGNGPLPVTLMLHWAGTNGPREPWEFIDPLLATAPGIYVTPVDICYINGSIDPVTGQGRGASGGMGSAHGTGVFSARWRA